MVILIIFVLTFNKTKTISAYSFNFLFIKNPLKLYKTKYTIIFRYLIDMVDFCLFADFVTSVHSPSHLLIIVIDQQLILLPDLVPQLGQLLLHLVVVLETV